MTEGAFIGKTLSHFRVLKKLGSGGMGEVYLAQDVDLDRQVALKVLSPDVAGDPERMRRFIQEAKAASALNHPNVATIHEIGEADGIRFIAMEYVDGQTLDAQIGGRTLETGVVLEIAIQVVDALEAAHAKGITHRDLKPANIMITAHGRVKVLDFGLAKVSPAMSNDAPTVMGTEPGIVMGTVSYLSPEQALGKNVDSRSDIFSFGIVLYEMVTGRLPFSGATAAETIDQIRHGQPTAIARFNYQIPHDLERIIRKCLEKDVEHRYQTLKDLRIDLKALKRDSGIVAAASTPAPTGEAPSRGLRSGQVAIVTIALVGVLFFGGMELLKRQLHSSPPAAISSVVVLPAKVLGSADMDYLTDAVPGTLSTLLAQVRGLDTKAPPTSFEVDEVHGDLKKIAAAYHVSTVLTSVITVEEDGLTLNVQLVNPETHSVVWSNQYLGKRSNYNELLRQAADGAGRALQPASARVTSTAGLATNSDAELAYRDGEHYLTQFNNLHENADFDIAVAAFKRALQLDPTLADAAANIGNLYLFKIEGEAPEAAMLPESEKWGYEALRINPRNGRGYRVLAEIAYRRGNKLDNVRYGLKAANAAPTDPFAQGALGRVASETLALEVLRESGRLDPLLLYPPLNEALILAYLGRTKEALPLVDNVLRTEPEMPAGLEDMFKLHLLAGPFPDTADLSKKLETLGTARTPRPLIQFLQDLYALEIATKPEPALNQIEFTQSTGLSTLVLVKIGKVQAALDLLVRQSASGTNLPYDFLMLSPDLSPLRKEPKFQPVLARSRAEFEQLVAVLEDARSHGELPHYLEKPFDELLVKLGMKK